MNFESTGDDQDVVYREFETEQADPNVAVVGVVAELEGVDTDELSPLYSCMDNVLEHLFSDPPDPAARAQVSFSYEGYRITVDQDGSATFQKVV